MESFFRTHEFLVTHLDASVRRDLMDQIDWNHRMIAIKGTRGVGKTTFLLQYAKEKFGTDRSCLYINMNNFYFSQHTLMEFVEEFSRRGGRVLLIDQAFKHPYWQAELRKCYDTFPRMRFVFSVSSVMRLTSKQEDAELYDIVKMYNLRGFSFREFLNLRAGLQLPSYSLDEILKDHERIARSVLSRVSVSAYLQEYLHHGFYPFFLEKRNFSENLLKVMNMMIEVDILIIKQIEQKYLYKIKKLLYLLAVDGSKAPNVSHLAEYTGLSRQTVMHYIHYLQDARLVNLVYKNTDNPKKPAQVLMHNTNLLYAFYPLRFSEKEIMEVFFANNLWKDHTLFKNDNRVSFVVDENLKFKFFLDASAVKRQLEDVYCVVKNSEMGHGNMIPLWLFGFLY